MTEGLRSVESFERGARINQGFAIAMGVIVVTSVALAALSFWKGDVRAFLNGHAQQPQQQLCKIGAGFAVLSGVTLMATFVLGFNAAREQKAAEARKEEKKKAQEKEEREHKLQQIRHRREKQSALRAELEAVKTLHYKDVESRMADCFKAQDAHGRQFLVRSMTKEHVTFIRDVAAIEMVANTIAETKQVPQVFRSLWNDHGAAFANWAIQSQADSSVINEFYSGLDLLSKRAARNAVSAKAGADISLASSIVEERMDCNLFKEAHLGLV